MLNFKKLLLISSIIILSSLSQNGCAKQEIKNKKIQVVEQVAEVPSLYEDRYAIPSFKYYAFNYAYSFAIAKGYNTHEQACDIAYYVLEFSRLYNLDPMIVTRKIFKESWFNSRALSHRINGYGQYIRDARGRAIPLAYGLSQINIEANGFKLKLLWSTDELKDRVNTLQDIIYFIYTPKYNIELGCYVLREYLDKFGNKYELALTAYWAGEYSDQFYALQKRGVQNPYIDDVLNQIQFDNNGYLYHNVRFKIVKY